MALPAQAGSGAGLDEPGRLRVDAADLAEDRRELAGIENDPDEVGDPGGEIAPVAGQHGKARIGGGEPPLGGRAGHERLLAGDLAVDLAHEALAGGDALAGDAQALGDVLEGLARA